MIENFTDLDDNKVHVADDILVKKNEYDKIFLNCYNTPEGKRMFDTLRERNIEVAIYNKGDSLEAVSYRQGMCDLVTQMEKCVDDALTSKE